MPPPTSQGKARASSSDRQSQPKSMLYEAAKTCLLGLLLAVALSRMLTATWFWGLETSRWGKARTYLPRPNITLTPEELLQYDGSNTDVPLYLALDGEIFDVSAGSGRRIYGPGGSYHVFAGKDCARGYATGCFKNDCTHDLRGLSEKHIKAVEGWKKFYNKHDDYFRVGTLLNPPIDPESPEWPPCNK